MNELRNYLLNNGIRPYDDRAGGISRSYALLQRAQTLYRRASWGGQVERLKAFLLRRPRALFDLDSLPRGQVRGRHYAGLRTVELSQVRGTLGRQGDFDAHFHPLDERLCERWTGVAVAWLQGLPLAPVTLIQAGEIYFVQDGHHRISVARALGQAAIEAEVTTWEIAGRLPWAQSLESASARRKAGLLNFGALI